MIIPLRDLLKRRECVWIEYRDQDYMIPTAPHYAQDNILVFHNGSEERISTYGLIWRCWDALPTEEDRTHMAWISPYNTIKELNEMIWSEKVDKEVLRDAISLLQLSIPK